MADKASPIDVQDPYVDFLADSQAEQRTFRRSVAIAVGVHVVLLLITFPSVYPTVEIEKPPTRKVYPIQRIVIRPPEAPPTEPLRAPRRPIPMPDLTPDEPEILPAEVPEPTFDTASLADVFLNDIPAAPPPLPQTGPYEVGGKVSAPARTFFRAPNYTEIARRARIEGVVILRAVIDRNGNVTDPQVLKGLPFGLTEEALTAVTEWKYDPSTLNGKPVDVYLNLSVHFKMQ